MKMILGTIMALMFLIAIGSVNAAQMMPAPVFGNVINTGNLGSLEVRMTNLNTGEVHVALTDGNGRYQFEWANSALGLVAGQRMKIELLIWSEGTVEKVFDGNFIRYDFDILGKVCPTCETCSDCPTCEICPDCGSCCEQCPPEANPDNCQEYCETQECPVADNTTPILVTAIASIVGSVAVMGGGMKIRKKKTGEVVTEHQHTGIVGYHDVNIRHINPRYRHRLYKDNPEGFKADVKKINEQGGL